MARPIRIEFHDGVYHIMSRGNAKAPIFLDDADRILFIDILAKTISVHKWLCQAYCLMNNHYHLLIETPEPNLSSGMHLLNGMYTQGFNKRHSRTGHVFQGRYKSIVIEKESYLLELTRYIVLNPVRAGYVDNPDTYRWSSFKATAGLIQTPGFLHTDSILEHFGSSRKRSVRAFIDFIQKPADPPSAIIENKNHIIGSDSFMEKMKPYLLELKTSKEIPRKQRFAGRPELEELFAQGLKKKSERNRLISQAFREFGYTQKEISVLTGLHYSTISRIIGSKYA